MIFDALVYARIIISAVMIFVSYEIYHESRFWPIYGITVGEFSAILLRIGILCERINISGSLYQHAIVFSQLSRLVGLVAILLAVRGAQKDLETQTQKPDIDDDR